LCYPTMGRPLTGAWIETLSDTHRYASRPRRPLTGAWIETASVHWLAPTKMVAPSRGRGLKPEMRRARELQRASPPHGGVD